jgi:hypothetical protein
LDDESNLSVPHASQNKTRDGELFNVSAYTVTLDDTTALGLDDTAENGENVTLDHTALDDTAINGKTAENVTLDHTATNGETAAAEEATGHDQPITSSQNQQQASGADLDLSSIQDDSNTDPLDMTENGRNDLEIRLNKLRASQKYDDFFDDSNE